MCWYPFAWYTLQNLWESQWHLPCLRIFQRRLIDYHSHLLFFSSQQGGYFAVKGHPGPAYCVVVPTWVNPYLYGVWEINKCFVGNQFFNRNLLDAQYNRASTDILVYNGPRLFILIIWEYPFLWRLNHDSNVLIFWKYFLDIIGSKGCSTLPYTFIFSANTNIVGCLHVWVFKIK